MTLDAPILDVRDLRVDFETEIGTINAVSDVTFTLNRGETLAIVGESGSGKTTIINAVLGLLAGNGRITSGQILFRGTDLAALSDRDFRKFRGAHLGLVPQDPMASLNPVLTIGDQVGEVLKVHGKANKSTVAAKSLEVLAAAGLKDAAARLGQYAHQFSGGMRQRVLIGIGLSCEPEILVADEPTSALDVTVQKQILDKLSSLTQELGTAMILITHDLGLAAERSEKIIVMNKGRIVEQGPSANILRNPQHEYTQRLVASAPSIVAASAGNNANAGVSVSSGPSEALVTVKGLAKSYRTRDPITKRRSSFHAVSDVSFEIPKGKTLAIVGESGSGKSTTARMILALEKPDSGSIDYAGNNIALLKGKQLKSFRAHVQPVFQDPYSSLNPMVSIGDILEEPLRVHAIGTKASRRRVALDLLGQVSLLPEMYYRFPSELSGGQRQRVAIARALALEPELIICDEPVSALDVLVQAQILELLKRLQAERQLSYLFISHDLAVVRIIAHEVLVMQGGKVVERGETEALFGSPQTDYTRTLLSSIPGLGLLNTSQS